jgi:hypothetical protein
MLLDGNLRQIKALIQSLGYELHLLWVTRDLIDIAISQCMQSLRSPRPKSPGLDYFLSSALRRIEQRIELIEAIQKSGVAWSFFDLSRTKSIESDVFEKLGVPISSFQKIPIMNRGFTLLEYQLIASLRFLPGPDRLSLSNQLNVSPSKEKLLKISFNTEEIRTFGNACNPLINQFNALVPENAQLPLITEESANREGVSLQELNELYIDDNRLGIISDWFHTRFIRKPPMKQSIFSKIKRKMVNIVTLILNLPRKG